MIYLGNQAVGLLAILPEWAKLNNIKLEFSQYQSFETATLFFSDSYVSSIISQLSNGNYKIVFNNNTDNTRAGQWIIFEKTDGSISNIQVMRVGLSKPQNYTYGLNVYEGAEGIIYIPLKEVTPNA